MFRFQLTAIVGFFAGTAFAADLPPVRAIAFSPDGTVLIVGTGTRGQAGGVVAFDVKSRKQIWQHAEPSAVGSLSIAPDGKSVAIARGTTTALRLDATTGRPLGEIGPHPKEVRAVAFTLDGLLATASDGTIRLWDTASGTVKKELTGHPVEVRSLVASANGKWLVSTGPDTTRIWDVAAGKELTGLIRQDRGIAYYGISFVGPDRVMLANNSAVQRVYQLPGGPELLRFKNNGGYDGSAHSEAAGLAAFCGFGGQAISIASLTFRPPNPEDQARIDKLIKDFDDDAIAVREAATAAMQQIGSVAEPALRKAMADGPSAEVKMRAREVRQAILDEPIRKLAGSTGVTGPMAFSPDGSLFVAGSDDGTIRAWDPRTGQQLARFADVAPAVQK